MKWTDRGQSLAALIVACSCFWGTSALTGLAQEQLRPHPVFRSAVADLSSASFPVPILVPFEQASAFDALFNIGASPSSGGRVSSDDYRAPGTPMYELTAGLPDGVPLATLNGFVGRGAYDAIAERGVNEEDCDRSAMYCAFSPFRAPSRLTTERFYGLMVQGQPAVATHTTCCNGESWSIGWYDARVGASYSVQLYLMLAANIGARDVDPGNLAQAQSLADLASALIPLSTAR